MTLLPAEDVAAGFAAHLDLAEPWRTAFADTPRHLFVPSRALYRNHAGKRATIDRDTDPHGWLRVVYSDQFIVTQVDDGQDSGEGDYTSSCSMPSVVASMLDTLDVEDGHQVLEIGTGTGWNAALLAHRLGADRVVSIEVDPGLAERARANLDAAGRPVRVVTGDGAEGWPLCAPYDRVIATCSVEAIPPAWIAQTRPGGRVVVPWGPPAANDHLVRFDVAEDGSAVGTIVGGAAFMRLRAQRWHVTDEPDGFDEIAERSAVQVAPREVIGQHSRLGVGLRIGEARVMFEDSPDGEVLWMLAADSWACVSATIARQAGARRLWDEAVDAYRWWVGLGSPDRDRFHITVTPERQSVWLDKPRTVVAAHA